MVITYHGGQCFKVTLGDLTLAFDPISKKSKFNSVKFGANLVLISLNHPDFNGVKEVTYGGKEPFVIDGPGEYEVGEATIRGFGVKTIYDKEERYNTIYQVVLEGINMVFLGALSFHEIDSKILSNLGDIEILFVPVGGGDVLDVAPASKLATKLEAKCIIPMHGDKKAIEAFLKEAGSDNGKPQDKLTIKKKDVAEMTSEVFIFKVR